MLAIATELLVKLFAFLAVGIFVTFWMFDGPGALLRRRLRARRRLESFLRQPPFDTMLASTLLSFVAIILLPRQFHVAVVENNNENEIKRAAWLFPLYLVAINLFVVPIALAGLLTFPAGHIDSDMFVLALPLQTGSNVLTIAAFVGGLSAATAMVIVEIGGALDYGVERHRHATGAAAARGADLGPRQCRFAAAHGAADRDLRHPAARLLILSHRRRRAACVHRPAVVRRDRAAGAGVFRRPVLAARHRRRRHRRHDGGHPGLGLYAAAAELRRHRHCWPAHPHRRPLAHHRAAAAEPVRDRTAATGAWSALESRRQSGVLHRFLPAPRADRRSNGCRPTSLCRRIWRRSRRPSGSGARR